MLKVLSGQSNSITNVHSSYCEREMDLVIQYPISNDRRCHGIKRYVDELRTYNCSIFSIYLIQYNSCCDNLYLKRDIILVSYIPKSSLITQNGQPLFTDFDSHWWGPGRPSCTLINAISITI